MEKYPRIGDVEVSTSTSSKTTTKNSEPNPEEEITPPLDNDTNNDLDFLFPIQSRLTKTERNPLEAWFKINYKTGPYPSRRELNALSIQSGLGIQKVRNWFVNARYRAKIRPQATKNVPYWITKVKYSDESDKSNTESV